MSNYIKLEPTGAYGRDKLVELSNPGKYSLPIKITYDEFVELYDTDSETDDEDSYDRYEEFLEGDHYVDCDVLKVDNTGRYQVIIARRADTGEVEVYYYNGAENRFKRATQYVEDGAYEYFHEDAESEIADEMTAFWEKVTS